MKRAFSLVELLVTITIIAVVSGLGLLAFIQTRDNARKSTLQARIRQFNIAKQQFVSDFGRLQAKAAWDNPPSPQYDVIPGQDNTIDERRYNILKRYIERPQQNLKEVVPEGTVLITPQSVYDLYTGQITMDSNNAQLIIDNTTGGVY
jgi:prepilin-type N-terminal cleavage/methylation domain-containing protein